MVNLLGTFMTNCETFSADENGTHVDTKKYKSMVGSLRYITTSRLDIMFSV